MVSVLVRFFELALASALVRSCFIERPSFESSRSVDEWDMFRGRFLNALPKPLLGKTEGESSRCGDRRGDFKVNSASASCDRFKQNDELVEVADNGLTSGEGVAAVMIGGIGGQPQTPSSKWDRSGMVAVGGEVCSKA